MNFNEFLISFIKKKYLYIENKVVHFAKNNPVKSLVIFVAFATTVCIFLTFYLYLDEFTFFDSLCRFKKLLIFNQKSDTALQDITSLITMVFSVPITVIGTLYALIIAYQALSLAKRSHEIEERSLAIEERSHKIEERSHIVELDNYMTESFSDAISIYNELYCTVTEFIRLSRKLHNVNNRIISDIADISFGPCNHDVTSFQLKHNASFNLEYIELQQCILDRVNKAKDSLIEILYNMSKNNVIMSISHKYANINILNDIFKSQPHLKNNSRHTFDIHTFIKEYKSSSFGIDELATILQISKLYTFNTIHPHLLDNIKLSIEQSIKCTDNYPDEDILLDIILSGLSLATFYKKHPFKTSTLRHGFEIDHNQYVPYNAGVFIFIYLINIIPTTDELILDITNDLDEVSMNDQDALIKRYVRKYYCVNNEILCNFKASVQCFNSLLTEEFKHIFKFRATIIKSFLK